MKQLSLIDSKWLDTCLKMMSCWERTRQFTTDELHDILPAPTERNLWGVLMAKAKKMGLVRAVGFQTSTRHEANARVVRLWEVVAP